MNGGTVSVDLNGQPNAYPPYYVDIEPPNSALRRQKEAFPVAEKLKPGPRAAPIPVQEWRYGWPNLLLILQQINKTSHELLTSLPGIW